MDVRWHLPLEELVRLERVKKDAARSKRLRIVILAIGDCDVGGPVAADLSAVGRALLR